MRTLRKRLQLHEVDIKQPNQEAQDRIGFDCVYPTRRKPPTRNANAALKKSNVISKVDNDKLCRSSEKFAGYVRFWLTCKPD